MLKVRKKKRFENRKNQIYTAEFGCDTQFWVIPSVLYGFQRFIPVLTWLFLLMGTCLHDTSLFFFIIHFYILYFSYFLSYEPHKLWLLEWLSLPQKCCFNIVNMTWLCKNRSIGLNCHIFACSTRQWRNCGRYVWHWDCNAPLTTVSLSLSLVRLCCTDRRKWRAVSVIWPAFITCCLRCLRICHTRSWLVELRASSSAARPLCWPSLQRCSHATCETLKHTLTFTHTLLQRLFYLFS